MLLWLLCFWQKVEQKAYVVTTHCLPHPLFYQAATIVVLVFIAVVLWLAINMLSTLAAA